MWGPGSAVPAPFIPEFRCFGPVTPHTAFQRASRGAGAPPPAGFCGRPAALSWPSGRPARVPDGPVGCLGPTKMRCGARSAPDSSPQRPPSRQRRRRRCRPGVRSLLHLSSMKPAMGAAMGAGALATAPASAACHRQEQRAPRLLAARFPHPNSRHRQHCLLRTGHGAAQQTHGAGKSSGSTPATAPLQAAAQPAGAAATAAAAHTGHPPLRRTGIFHCGGLSAGGCQGQLCQPAPAPPLPAAAGGATACSGRGCGEGWDSNPARSYMIHQ